MLDIKKFVREWKQKKGLPIEDEMETTSSGMQQEDGVWIGDPEPKPIRKESRYNFRTKCSYADTPSKLGNVNFLPVVETTYNTTYLNKARQNGYTVLIIKRSLNPNLTLKSLLLKNRQTAEHINVSSRHVNVQYGRPPIKYPEDEWELIQEIEGYARDRSFEQNSGAYLIPKIINVGDRVYIEDLIEDIVAGAFWGSVSLAVDAEAIWNGSTLEIEHSAYDRFERIG